VVDRARSCYRSRQRVGRSANRGASSAQHPRTTHQRAGTACPRDPPSRAAELDRALSEGVNETQSKKLDSLLGTRADSRHTTLGWLREPGGAATPNNIRLRRLGTNQCAHTGPAVPTKPSRWFGPVGFQVGKDLQSFDGAIDLEADIVRPAKAGAFSGRQSHRGKSRSPVAWVAGSQLGNRILKPTDNAIVRMAASHQAVAQANKRWPRKFEVPEGRACNVLAKAACPNANGLMRWVTPAGWLSTAW
jgi:hypothetical protein